MSILDSWDLGMHLNSVLVSFLLKFPKTSSEIPTLLLFLPLSLSLLFLNLDSSNSISSSLHSEVGSRFLIDLLADYRYYNVPMWSWSHLTAYAAGSAGLFLTIS